MAVSSGYSSLISPVASTASPVDEADKGDYWSLSKCRNAFTNYLDNKREEIEEQQDARRYRHAAQWTAKQVEVFNKRKQPVVTYNRIGRKIDAIVGLTEKLKLDPKAFPRGPGDGAGAELATACVRYVVEGDLREYIFPFIAEDLAVNGIGGVEMMLVEGDKGDTDIGFALIEQDSFFYDTRSVRHDFSDARYAGVAKWLEKDDIVALVPEKADEIEEAAHPDSEFTTNPDRERKWFNTDGLTKQIRVVELWYKHHGEWCWALFTGSLILLEGKGYFYDEKGKTICKYIMASCFVDHDGDRYGFIRNLKSPQDEINQRRSKGLHELNSRRIKAEDGAFADVEVARREAVKPDGVVVYQKGFEMEFDDATRIANMEGQIKFLEDAKNEIENFGPNPALIGQGLEYKSGRAINLLQQAGIAELGPYMIGVRNLKLRLYRAIWCAIQRYWVGERYIRVVNDEGIAEFVQVNGVGMDPATGMPRMVNAIGQLDVNIVMDEGPDEINMMADSYDTLVALATQGAQIPPAVLLELSPLQPSIKRKLLALLEKKDPAQDMAKQIALASEMAKVKETQSKATLNEAKAQSELQGGEYTMAERQMDAQAQREKHGMEMTKMMGDLQAQREKNDLERQKNVDTMRINQAKEAQKAALEREKAVNALNLERASGAQRLRQSEEQHRQKLRQKPKKGPSNA